MPVKLKLVMSNGSEHIISEQMKARTLCKVLNIIREEQELTITGDAINKKLLQGDDYWNRPFEMIIGRAHAD